MILKRYGTFRRNHKNVKYIYIQYIYTESLVKEILFFVFLGVALGVGINWDLGLHFRNACTVYLLQNSSVYFTIPCDLSGCYSTNY